MNATSGTTVLGAYDDLEAISEVCQSFEPKVWLHVDACWGGSVILSPKLEFLMKGVELVDSLVKFVTVCLPILSKISWPRSNCRGLVRTGATGASAPAKIW